MAFPIIDPSIILVPSYNVALAMPMNPSNRGSSIVSILTLLLESSLRPSN